ncbi:MAG: extracellular solute-binding protein, partial [Acetatifactor sp.]|nr:extracellular solute-binding protein [Acetatifactor sp.]
VCCFGPKTEETEGTLRLANLWYNDSDVKIAAVTYSNQHPDCQIAYETDWENQEGFYERIMAQMAVGQGPDILFVFGEDMDRLSARGLLADLSDVLEEDTRKQLFSGVMTAGIRDGKLAGLPRQSPHPAW